MLVEEVARVDETRENPEIRGAAGEYSACVSQGNRVEMGD